MVNVSVISSYADTIIVQLLTFTNIYIYIKHLFIYVGTCAFYYVCTNVAEIKLPTAYTWKQYCHFNHRYNTYNIDQGHLL